MTARPLALAYLLCPPLLAVTVGARALWFAYRLAVGLAVGARAVRP